MSKCKVKALWNMGYNNKSQPAHSVFECDLEWAKRKEANNRVEILEVYDTEKTEEESTTTEDINQVQEDSGVKSEELLSLNVNEASKRISNTDNISLLNIWRSMEEENNNRVTVLSAIDNRISNLRSGSDG